MGRILQDNEPLKMEQIKCSETSAFNNQTPVKYLKDYTLYLQFYYQPYALI